jgi:hypothetical protein
VEGCDVVVTVEEAAGDGDGEDGVVGEVGLGIEEREVGALDAVPLVDGSDDIAGDGSEHGGRVRGRVVP